MPRRDHDAVRPKRVGGSAGRSLDHTDELIRESAALALETRAPAQAFEALLQAL